MFDTAVGEKPSDMTTPSIRWYQWPLFVMFNYNECAGCEEGELLYGHNIGLA